jgi:hypothetical protein
MAQTLEYSPDSTEINGILQRYFDIYLPASLDDQMEEKGDNPFLSVNGMMEMVDQNDINNAREVVQLTEGYFKDILNSKYYEYFIADAVGAKKYIFQKSGSIIGTKVIAISGNPGAVEQKYSFEGDNPIMSLSDLISDKGPSYAQAQGIDYDRQATYSARLLTRQTFDSSEDSHTDSSRNIKISGDEASKYYIEFPILIMRNATPMHEADLQRLKAYSQKVAGGKLEIEVSVSPYTVLYVDEVPGSEQTISYTAGMNNTEDAVASEGGLYNSRMDFYIRAADGLVADILSYNDDVRSSDLLEAVRDIFPIGEDVRLFGSSNSYEAAGAIEKIFLDGSDVKIRVKSTSSSNGFRLEPVSGVSSKILGITSSSVRVGITQPGAGGKKGRDSKSSRNSKGSAIKTINIYSATENRSDALNPFPRQFLGPKLDGVAKLVNEEKVKKEAERKAAAERNRRAYKYSSSQYYAPPIDYQDILIEGFNSLTNAFTGEENAGINRRFNALVEPQLKSDRDRFFEITSSKISPKEDINDSLRNLYTFDTSRIRFFKAYDMVAIKINIFYNPFNSLFDRSSRIGRGKLRPDFRSGNGRLSCFDLSGVKIGLKVSK